MRDPFGWAYPPGAERDPLAPWNERDEDDDTSGDEPDGDAEREYDEWPI